MLKEAGPVIADKLRDLCNSTIHTGNIPEGWKIAEITALPKKGDVTEAANTRPISKHSNIAKCCERIVVSGMKSRLLQANFYSDLQYGFMEGKSTKANLMDYLLKVQQELNDDAPCDVIYFDFQKCFDRISHEVLLKKLKKAGISGNIGRWFEKFLESRLQCVRVLNARSPYHQVTSSVIQGSVIGPAAFLVMINDLPAAFDGSVFKYFFADDFKLLMPIKDGINSAKMLQHQIDVALNWSVVNKLPFNAKKCEVLHLGVGNEEFEYKMGNVTLKKAEEVVDLGIKISSKSLLESK